MSPEEAMRWKARFAAMYALGTWTLLGYFVYYYRVRPREAEAAQDRQGPPEAATATAAAAPAAPAWGGAASWEAEFDEERTRPNETPADAFFTSTVKYKKNPVPSTTGCMIM